MKKILFLIMALACHIPYMLAQQTVRGTVLSSGNHRPLERVSISDSGSNISTFTDEKGAFLLQISGYPVKLVISRLGFKNTSVTVDLPIKESYTIEMNENSNELEEVVINTGYQTLPKERATGSFVQVDNNLLSRRVSTSILDRLEDVTSGLIFNKGMSSGGNPISIRGQNTIYGNSAPLIVIDNFPYEGSIENINPNDVESITVLKDAAAASIWGSRAGNGVIVITTKKGEAGQAPQISFNSNVTIGDKPNLFYQPRMSSSDFIDIEKKLFEEGYYRNAENSYRNEAITPVAEILIAQRDGLITQEQANTQIESLRGLDVRNDYEKYFYRRSINQQYALNMRGGSANHKYFISTGYDKNRDNLIGNGYERITLNGSNTISLLKDRLEVSNSVYYVHNKTTTNNPGTDYIGVYAGSSATMYPYAQMADENGSPLPITHDYRSGFTETAEQLGFLDWKYYPLEEIRIADNSSGGNEYRINTRLSYKVIKGLNVEAYYQYIRTAATNRNLHNMESYFTRNLINNYTQVQADGTLMYPIPYGSIMDISNTVMNSHSVRGQLSYTNAWQKNELTAILGYELRDSRTGSSGNRLYGYDESHAIPTRVDYVSLFPQYNNLGNQASIPFNDYVTDLTDRYISYYGNAAYTYSGKYSVTGSARFDRSNLFGVDANQKGVPLYSFGAGWLISGEDHYDIDWLSYLKLRATYGYNGNINKSLSAYTTAAYSSGNAINQTYARIVNPPNPGLRWERVNIINIGLDFSSRSNRISGTIEPYFKHGKDLIGDIAFAPSTGITEFRGNTANTSGHGIDLTLNTRNIDRNIKWQTNFLFSFVKDKVVDYDLKQPALYYTQYANNEIYPLSGKPLYGVYSYAWAGLDPSTGEAQGYLNREISKDYAGIIASDINNIIYHGPARPTMFGSIRNTIQWRQLVLSVNINYRFGYFFRERGIFYNNVLTGQGYQEGNYGKRWQASGDEQATDIPSLPSDIDVNRDNFYNYSEATVEKADNIRLQDINISYIFRKEQLRRFPAKQIQLYLYANNLGTIWKATDSGLDPDYPSAAYVPVKTIAFGIKIDF